MESPIDYTSLMTTDTTPTPEEVEAAIDESFRGKLDLDIYNLTDLCRRLDLHRVTLMKAIKDEKLRAIPLGGPAGFRVFHDDVIDWLESLATIERKRQHVKGLKVRLS